jgi:hypothetical protein
MSHKRFLIARLEENPDGSGDRYAVLDTEKDSRADGFVVCVRDRYVDCEHVARKLEALVAERRRKPLFEGVA